MKITIMIVKAGLKSIKSFGVMETKCQDKVTLFENLSEGYFG